LQVFNREGLAAAWAQDPNFLKQQVAPWVQRKQLRTLEAVWPQLIEQAATAARASCKPLAGSAAAAAGKKKKKKQQIMKWQK
jgi:uncharacterized protein YjaZ